MREIEFRGKRVDNGEWHYGFYREFAVPYPWKIHAYRDGINYYIDAPETNESHLVIPETVGQFTGRRDKNGVKLFDGDIFILGDINIKHVVIWHDNGFMGKQLRTKGSMVGLTCWEDRIEIIGNIYEQEANNVL